MNWSWLSIAWAVISKVPAVLRHLPTVFRYAPQVIEIFGKGKALADAFERDTGISVRDIVGKALAAAKDAIPMPQEIKPGSVEEQTWFDRNSGPAN